MYMLFEIYFMKHFFVETIQTIKKVYWAENTQKKIKHKVKF